MLELRIRGARREMLQAIDGGRSGIGGFAVAVIVLVPSVYLGCEWGVDLKVVAVM